ncbi:hypothetical protein R1T16_10790 [Flavobacterium sp. DG1-102-2]|uniref:hypothetical protein n=1 Tax=Flavobacterium sp. DG1-102-2 TaxID=3081663 RepID=UPI0029494BE0|nr:hypothetical protein [Flavobacterium sp. DG1-102-2]MDV6168914.1 hypothetical protein [Flavobacterium sp. DG1-102-2]
MKRKILQSTICFLLIGMAWSCSNDSDVVMSDAGSRDIRQKNKNVWEGQIAEEVDGQLILTADRDELIEAFQSILLRQSDGENVEINQITLVRKFASNNSQDSAVFLIGGGRSPGGSTVSSGVILVAGGTGSGKMFFSPGPINAEGDPTSVSCWGCGTGCFLEYYNIDGHKVPYCNSAGCGPLCDRIFD